MNRSPIQNTPLLKRCVNIGNSTIWNVGVFLQTIRFTTIVEYKVLKLIYLIYVQNYFVRITLQVSEQIAPTSFICGIF